jgi:hypothetical protein
MTKSQGPQTRDAVTPTTSRYPGVSWVPRFSLRGVTVLTWSGRGATLAGARCLKRYFAHGDAGFAPKLECVL